MALLRYRIRYAPEAIYRLFSNVDPLSHLNLDTAANYYLICSSVDLELLPTLPPVPTSPFIYLYLLQLPAQSQVHKDKKLELGVGLADL